MSDSDGDYDSDKGGHCMHVEYSECNNRHHNFPAVLICNIPSLQAFHTAGMWEQYRDDAFAERGVEPRPPILTGAAVAGEIYSSTVLHQLLFSFTLSHF